MFETSRFRDMGVRKRKRRRRRRRRRSTEFNLHGPHRAARYHLRAPRLLVPLRDRRVVAQVEFERHILKPGLMFKGKGLKPVAFKLWVNIVQLAPPHRAPGPGCSGTSCI